MRGPLPPPGDSRVDLGEIAPTSAPLPRMHFGLSAWRRFSKPKYDRRKPTDRRGARGSTCRLDGGAAANKEIVRESAKRGTNDSQWPGTARSLASAGRSLRRASAVTWPWGWLRDLALGSRNAVLDRGRFGWRPAPDSLGSSRRLYFIRRVFISLSACGITAAKVL